MVNNNMNTIDTQSIDIILRHTKYTNEEAKQKLSEHNNNYMEVIRAYLATDSTINSAIKLPYSTNQQRFKEMRNMLGYVPVKLIEK